MIRNKPREAAVYGVDLGKNLFHVVGTDSVGNVVQRAKFRRDTVLAFFELATPSVIGIEACPDSQWFARKFQAMGHTVRIIPAQFVKSYVKSNKNDTIDAAAIAEDVTRPSMRFVEVKAVEQVDLQVLRRIRDQMVAARTRLIREYSTGGKTTLLGISKRVNHYLRRLLVHGARSCLLHLDRSRHRLGPWLDSLQSRMHINKVTVALAAKVARIAWVILTRPGALYERRDPTFA